MTRILTGMQASGNPHIGNYLGMMKPAIELQNNSENDCFYFIADWHAFTSNKNSEVFKENQKNCVLDWLALGLDPEVSTFYLQSDIKAHTEMMWYLSCMTPFGLMERAHSYKDKVAKGLELNVGLFTYPILMAADILLYDAEIIPVGKDQIQHVEMARDIAQKFNHLYGDTFVLPEADVKEEVKTIPGTDGAKMSKSYGNTIDIFASEKDMKKAIMGIQTDSKNLGDPLDPETCHVFRLHELFENSNLDPLRDQYMSGSIGYGDSKKQLFELVWNIFSEAREERERLVANHDYVDFVLNTGADKARRVAEKKLALVRKKMGLDS